MDIPLVFVAAGLVIEDRKTIRMTVLITAISLALIDRTCILESMSRSWGAFDESKRGGGPLSYGSNQTAAFLAQFAMFYWGFVKFIKAKKFKLAGYGLVVATLFANMYTFSRGGYLSVLVGVLFLGLVKDRKLLLILGVFLFTWQAIVPTPVRERVNMTKTADGQLETSAEERVELWQNAEKSIIASPIVGGGYATFQMGEHVDNLKDTHNWYVKVLVETGFLGLIIDIWMLQQVLATSYRLFKRATDPLYQGLGLGLFVAFWACITANFFGDRWTYLEITGLLWVLVSAAIRATELTALDPATETTKVEAAIAKNPYLAYR
jgi:O-antigen ligase